MKIKNLIIGILAAGAVLCGCQPKEPEPAKIAVSTPTLSFAQTGGNQTVTVTCNYSWEATCDASWIQINPAKGDATETGATVTITVLENTASEERTATVNFYGNNSRLCSAATLVKQAAKEIVIETVSVADFIKAADTKNPYKLTGKVSNISNSASYQAFDLTDATGKILVFFPENFDEYSGKMATGGTVTVQGVYEYYASKSQHEVVKATILEYAAPQEEDPSKVKQITIKEFIDAADIFTTYRLVGTVTTDPDKTYGSFDMKDATGSIKVYNIKDNGGITVEKGGTVTLRGKYSYYEKSSTHEVIEAVIEKFEGQAPPEEKDTESISDILDDEDGVIYNLKNVTVVAAYAKGYLVYDGDNYLLIYEGGSEPAAEPGDKIEVKGTLATYNGFRQLTKTTTTIIGEAEVPEDDPEDITADFDNFSSETVKLISVTGNLVVTEGTTKYYNIEVAGSDKKGSISYPIIGDVLDALAGSQITVTGYYIGTNTNKSNETFINMMLTGIDSEGEQFFVSPISFDVKADVKSVDIQVLSSVTWTVKSTDPEFVPSVTSGENNATVTVTFGENTTTENRSATIVFETTADVPQMVYKVVINQKGIVEAGNSADFETFNGGTPKSSYGSYETESGWQIVNGCVQKGGEGDNNPVFVFIGKSDITGDWAFAACINGRTDKSGELTSPEISGGCGELSFSYGYAFKETNGIAFKVEVIQNGNTVKSFDVVDKNAAQKTKYTFKEDVNVSGDFELKFSNLNPSNKNDGNIDRYSIWDVAWTSK